MLQNSAAKKGHELISGLQVVLRGQRRDAIGDPTTVNSKVFMLIADPYLGYLGDIINGRIHIEYSYLYENRISTA